MGGAKTAEQNRAGFQKFYDNPVNRFRYLKAKTMTRIDNKERCMLRTLRKYGLIDYYNETTSRALKRILKEEIDLEPILLTKPEPYVYPDGQISYQSMKAKTPAAAQSLAEREGTTELLNQSFNELDAGDQEAYVESFPLDNDVDYDKNDDMDDDEDPPPPAPAVPDARASP